MRSPRQQFILALAGYLALRYDHATDYFTNIGINLEHIRQGLHEPTPEQGDLLLHRAAMITHDEAFGLHLGESLQLAALGIVGQIIQASQTVGDAITIAASLAPTITDLFTLDVCSTKDEVEIVLSSTSAATTARSASLMGDFLLAFTVRELDGILLRRVEPLRIEYAFSSPHHSELKRVLRCDTLKAATTCKVVLQRSILDLPIHTANYELQQVLLKQHESNHTNFAQPSFREKVMILLRGNGYLGTMTLEDVAANFNITSRSLQRRLQEEGSSFQQLSDEIRKSLAMEYVHSGKYALKEISALLGYNEASAFTRAFKRWTGRAPMEFRS